MWGLGLAGSELLQGRASLALCPELEEPVSRAAPEGAQWGQSPELGSQRGGKGQRGGDGQWQCERGWQDPTRQGLGREHEPESLYLLENEGFHSSDEGARE